MLSVSASAGLLGTPDLGGAPTPAAATGAGDGSAAAFASMLATRVAEDRARDTVRAAANAAAQSRDTEGGSNADAPATGEPPTVDPSHAAASAAATAVAASATNVRHVTRDITTLTPALRERLGRVVDRMQREYGYRVEIAEAGRTQGRQDYLFAQGRTRSGPVVTWTRDSEHTRGRAVDVTIDGSYDDPIAFARLQQIAQSEGLHTLGARDPGHLQLPRDVPGGVPALALGTQGGPRITVESFGTRTEVVTPPTAPPGAFGGVAPVAQVASVAAVAGVAQVAAVAGTASPALAPDVGASASAREPRHAETRSPTMHGRSASADTTTDAANASVPEAATARTRTDDAGDGASSDAGGRDRDPHHAPGPRVDSGRASVAAPSPGWANAVSDATGTRPASEAATPSDGPAAGPILGAIAAERIARVLDAQQDATPRTVSHLTLRVERAGGGEDRIRLDMRGRAVEARIDVADIGAADQLTARSAELRAALAQHGFTTDDVRVQSSADVALAAGARDPARDQGTRDQHARDPSGGGDAPRDGRTSDRGSRDGTSGERRGGNERQNRPAADAYLDAGLPRAGRRTTT